MSGIGDVIPTGSPGTADTTDDTTLIVGVTAAIGALFLLVLILFILFVLYYYKNGDPIDEEEYYHSSRATSRAGSRRGSRAGSRAGSLSRRGSIVRSASLRNSFHPDRVFLPNNGWNQSQTSEETSSKKAKTKNESSSNGHQMIHGSLNSLRRSFDESIPQKRSPKKQGQMPVFSSLRRSVSSSSDAFRPGYPMKASHTSSVESFGRNQMNRINIVTKWSKANETKSSSLSGSLNRSTPRGSLNTGSLNLPRREKTRPSVLTYTHYSVRSLDSYRREELRTKLMEDPKFKAHLKRSGSMRTPASRRRGGSTNRGFSDEYKDLDKELWKQRQLNDGTTTHNPLANLANMEDDYNPIEVNLDSFDKGVNANGKPALDKDLDSGMAENVDKDADNEDAESSQIQILDMRTWSGPSPPASPRGNDQPGAQPTPFTISAQIASSQKDSNFDGGADDDIDAPTQTDYGIDFSRANPFNNGASSSELNQAASMKRGNQSIVDFYENANPKILGYSMDFPADAYGTGRRLLWQKKHFDEK